MSAEEIIREYPELETEDIRQALQYASALANEDMGVSLTTVKALRAANHDAVHLRDENLVRLEL